MSAFTDDAANGFAPGRHLIEAYGNGGFLFCDMTHRGSILALPSGIYAWAPTSVQDINQASLQRVLQEQPESINHLLVGCGEAFAVLPAELRMVFKRAGIVVESMSTGAAVRTYNILLGERRCVAGAFLAAP